MSKLHRVKQTAATIEEDPVTGPHWVLRIPVKRRYDIATAARLLGTSRVVLKQRIQADRFEADEDGCVSHATLAREVERLRRRAIGRSYRKQLVKILQVDFEVEVPDNDSLEQDPTVRTG